jgi:hypothetical protein
MGVGCIWHPATEGRKTLPEMERLPMELTFNTVFEEREGAHVAVCLEMGLVATADNKDDLSAIMDKLISRQLNFALQNQNFQDIYHPADQAWQYLRDAFAKQTAKEVRTNKERMDGATINVVNTAYAVNC